MSKSKKQEFRIDLRGKYVDYFNRIQKRNNFDTIVAVFRHSLEQTEKLEQGDIQPAGDIHPKLQYTLNRYINRPDVQLHFGIANQSDLVRAAVESYIEEIEDFVSSRSLVHWDIRSNLTGDEHEVALAFTELHMESDDGTVSLDNLVKELGWNKSRKLVEIMDEFVFQGLVERENIGQKVIYHAY